MKPLNYIIKVKSKVEDWYIKKTQPKYDRLIQKGIIQKGNGIKNYKEAKEFNKDVFPWYYRFVENLVVDQIRGYAFILLLTGATSIFGTYHLNNYVKDNLGFSIPYVLIHPEKVKNKILIGTKERIKELEGSLKEERSKTQTIDRIVEEDNTPIIPTPTPKKSQKYNPTYKKPTEKKPTETDFISAEQEMRNGCPTKNPKDREKCLEKRRKETRENGINIYEVK